MSIRLRAAKAAVARSEVIANYNRETVLPLLDVLDEIAELHRLRTGEYSTAAGHTVEGDHCRECTDGGLGGAWPCNTAVVLGLDLR